MLLGGADVSHDRENERWDDMPKYSLTSIRVLGGSFTQSAFSASVQQYECNGGSRES